MRSPDGVRQIWKKLPGFEPIPYEKIGLEGWRRG
jgi:hypothetical protein